MKKSTKVMVVSGVALLLGTGSAVNFQRAQMASRVSFLSIDDIEVLGGPIILDQGQTAIIPDQRNNPRGKGCIDKGGTCEISNNGGW